MSFAPTVVMYSPDTVGLGHTRRNSAIASALVSAVPGASVVLLVGSSVGSIFEVPSGVDSIKLPSVLKTGVNDWRARSLGISKDATLRIRSGLIRETIEALRPDLLLIDHLPAGIWGELLPTFETIRRLKLKTKVVLGLRDILDEPERVRRRWSEEGIYEVIARHYDAVFIYGERRIFDTAEAYGLDVNVCDEIHYLGYVRGETSGRKGKQLPAAGLPSGPRHVLVSAGGGYDAYPMMTATMAGFERIAGACNAKMTMVTGPLMPVEHATKLEAQAAGLPVQVIRFSNRMGALLEAADLIVTMGGYNSMLEIAALGKPAINIPRTGPSREQTLRAMLFEKMGLMTHLPLEQATPERIGGLLQTRIQKPPRLVPTLEANGASRAARRISRLLSAPVAGLVAAFHHLEDALNAAE